MSFSKLLLVKKFEIMKFLMWLILGCLTQINAHAVENNLGEVVVQPVDMRRITAPPSLSDTVLRQISESMRVIGTESESTVAFHKSPKSLNESTLARAIGKAAHKGLNERSVEGYTEVINQCQKSQSTVLTTPFLRSESQQAHCFRF